LLMESSILSEVDDTSILRTGLSIRYRGPLALPASRLLLPRSGLERSDFVPCTKADMPPGFIGSYHSPMNRALNLSACSRSPKQTTTHHRLPDRARSRWGTGADVPAWEV